MEEMILFLPEQISLYMVDRMLCRRHHRLWGVIDYYPTAVHRDKDWSKAR